MNNDFEAFRKVLETREDLVLTTHLNPDGDGLGSELALGSYLKSLGKRVKIINHSPTPESYHFLDRERQIATFDPERHAGTIANAGVIIVLDTNQPDRLGRMRDPVLSSSATKVIIDHHLDANPFADLMILDEEAAATGQIVYNLLRHLQGPAVSPVIAQSLYIALMTDTGSFRFPKTTAKVHRVIAELIECGADPVGASQAVYEQSSPARLRLLGKALASLKTTHQGTVAYLTITQEMFQETQTSEPDVDQFAPYTLSIKGVQIGLMFTELPDQIKVSFRSKGDIWINKLAQEFGGNGHKNAAGARIENATLEDVVHDVVNRASSYL